MDQISFIEKILDRFDMQDCKTKTIPCDVSVAQLTVDDTECSDPKFYREIVGSLIYLMTSTRPDLAYVVTFLSQFMSKPQVSHLNVAKHVLRYLKYSIDYSLTFKRCSSVELSGYCDADWATTKSFDGRSVSGFAFSLNDSGPLISWKCRKQSVVSLSSCEAEYVSVAHAIQEGLHLRQLLSDMTGQKVQPILLRVDNLSAISIAKNPITNQRSKHINVKYHFIRDYVKADDVILEFVPSQNNVADMFTKPCTREKLLRFSCIRGHI